MWQEQAPPRGPTRAAQCSAQKLPYPSRRRRCRGRQGAVRRLQRIALVCCQLLQSRTQQQLEAVGLLSLATKTNATYAMVCSNTHQNTRIKTATAIRIYIECASRHRVLIRFCAWEIAARRAHTGANRGYIYAPECVKFCTSQARAPSRYARWLKQTRTGRAADGRRQAAGQGRGFTCSISSIDIGNERLAVR